MTELVQRFLEGFHSPLSAEDDTESRFELSLLSQGPVLYILVRGELEFHQTGRFDEAVGKAIAEPTCKEIVIHMGGVTFVDSTGLACLVNASQIVRERGGRVHLVSCTPFVLRTMEITRLKRVFMIHETFQGAYDAVQQTESEPS